MRSERKLLVPEPVGLGCARRDALAAERLAPLVLQEHARARARFGIEGDARCRLVALVTESRAGLGCLAARRRCGVGRTAMLLELRTTNIPFAFLLAVHGDRDHTFGGAIAERFRVGILPVGEIELVHVGETRTPAGIL